MTDIVMRNLGSSVCMFITVRTHRRLEIKGPTERVYLICVVDYVCVYIYINIYILHMLVYFFLLKVIIIFKLEMSK